MPTATLDNGQTIDYSPDKIGEGAMKDVYLSCDGKSVICFYRDPKIASDPERKRRLEAIVRDYNPTTGEDGEYYKQRFCWPQSIIISPKLGFVAPAYSKQYKFKTGKFSGKEKQVSWFSRPKLLDLLPASDQGHLRKRLIICIHVARTVRRLHLAGLAHGDLSEKNVLIDPIKGDSVLLDLDSLVVPGRFYPDVLGTRKYIAPEVLGTIGLPVNDPMRQHPSINTDLHALAVLIYEILLIRHPLEGPKIHPAAGSAEEHECLSYGAQALFIEHPSDQSNRPKNLNLPASSLGSHLNTLFSRAFVDGLHSPEKRPSAMEWEIALSKTLDLLYPCYNPACVRKWFVVDKDNTLVCPECKTKPAGNIPLITLSKEIRPGRFYPDRDLVVYPNSNVFQWHVFDNKYPPIADKHPQAFCKFQNNKWLLVNQKINLLRSPLGSLVPLGYAIELNDGIRFKMSDEPHGRMADVRLLSVT